MKPIFKMKDQIRFMKTKHHAYQRPKYNQKQKLHSEKPFNIQQKPKQKKTNKKKQGNQVR